MILRYSWHDLTRYYTLRELLNMAKARGCKGISRAKKEELVGILLAMRICWPGFEN